jgi:hypothetical protein
MRNEIKELQAKRQLLSNEIQALLKYQAELLGQMKCFAEEKVQEVTISVDQAA